MPYGRRLTDTSRFVSTTLDPSIARMDSLWSPLRVTKARLPSGVNTGSDGVQLGSPRSTFPAGVTVRPSIAKTETVPSLRLATRAMVPAGLIETPDGPLPACSVARIAGGDDLRSITVTVSSGTVVAGSEGSMRVDAVMIAIVSSGDTATLCGGLAQLPGAFTS